MAWFIQGRQQASMLDRKVVVVGPTYSGKTALVRRFLGYGFQRWREDDYVSFY
jgi:GTPase SAR1 family protein